MLTVQSTSPTATHLVFHFENITSSKERFVSDTEPEGLVGLGMIELDSSSFAWIIREKVSCQADVQEIIADWFKQHLSFSHSLEKVLFSERDSQSEASQLQDQRRDPKQKPHFDLFNHFHIFDLNQKGCDLDLVFHLLLQLNLHQS